MATTSTEVAASYRALDAGAQKEVQDALGLNQPVGDTGRTIIWAIVLLSLLVIVLVFGYWSYKQLSASPKKDAEALIGVTTAALGGFIGLLAPSPTAKK